MYDVSSLIFLPEYFIGPASRRTRKGLRFPSSTSTICRCPCNSLQHVPNYWLHVDWIILFWSGGLLHKDLQNSERKEGTSLLSAGRKLLWLSSRRKPRTRTVLCRTGLSSTSKGQTWSRRSTDYCLSGAFRRCISWFTSRERMMNSHEATCESNDVKNRNKAVEGNISPDSFEQVFRTAFCRTVHELGIVSLPQPYE